MDDEQAIPMAHLAMRTHHNLAAVAGLFKDATVWSLVRALDGVGEPLYPDAPYDGAHYDPIILGFILGRNWEQAEDEALSAIARDLDYDRMITSVSPRAETYPERRAIKVVKGLDVSKLDFNL